MNSFSLGVGDKMVASTRVKLPRKHDLHGVKVSATTYEEVVDCCIAMAQCAQSAIVDLMPVHGLVSAATDESYKNVMNAFDIVAPDGQPVRWSLNFFHRAHLADRVYGPALTYRLCEAAANNGVPIYLYGSSPDVIAKLCANLMHAFPNLQIVGAESPPFRPLTPEEDQQVIDRINSSGAGLVFLGTGCPKQELFAYHHRHSIKGVQLCVGAAFDFHAGVKKVAPPWMQKRGLEWLFRLTQEPKRLWKRYFIYNSIFLWLTAKTMVTKRRASEDAIFEEEQLATREAA
jgi:N-acetylglucosaminyldiphosphoundecaprenol N-acetyl-beta-D-mannosaminyltransferase